jgi:hypothetical protein
VLLKQYWWLLFAALIILPLIASALFARWIRRRGNLSVTDAAKCWDVFLKFLSAMTAICAGAFVFAKYVDQRIETDRNAQVLHEVDYQKQRLEREEQRQKAREVLFGEAKLVAAKLATATDVSLASPVRQRFEELYWASLIGVEQKGGDVSGAMVAFRNAMNGGGGGADLHQLSLQLSNACEIELKNGEAEIEGIRKEIKNLYAKK